MLSSSFRMRTADCHYLISLPFSPLSGLYCGSVLRILMPFGIPYSSTIKMTQKNNLDMRVLKGSLFYLCNARVQICQWAYVWTTQMITGPLLMRNDLME